MKPALKSFKLKRIWKVDLENSGPCLRILHMWDRAGVRRRFGWQKRLPKANSKSLWWNFLFACSSKQSLLIHSCWPKLIIRSEKKNDAAQSANINVKWLNLWIINDFLKIGQQRGWMLNDFGQEASWSQEILRCLSSLESLSLSAWETRLHTLWIGIFF